MRCQCGVQGPRRSRAVDITLRLSAGACNKSARRGGRIGTQLLGPESNQKARVRWTKGVRRTAIANERPNGLRRLKARSKGVV